jgi:hypothetical protein
MIALRVISHGNPNVLTRDKGTSSLAQGCSGQLTAVQVERLHEVAPPARAFEPPHRVNGLAAGLLASVGDRRPIAELARYRRAHGLAPNSHPTTAISRIGDSNALDRPPGKAIFQPRSDQRCAINM